MARQVNVDGRERAKQKPWISIQNYNLWCQWIHSVRIWFLGGCCSSLAFSFSVTPSSPCFLTACNLVPLLHSLFPFRRNGILYLVFRPRTQVAFMALHCGGRWIEQSFWRWRRIDGIVCVFSFPFLVFQFICIFGGELPDLFIETCVKWIYFRIRIQCEFSDGEWIRSDLVFLAE